jgi:hypothetical protein
VVLPAEQAVAEQALAIEPVPVVGAFRLPDRQALAEERFGRGPFRLLQKVPAQGGEGLGDVAIVAAEFLPPSPGGVNPRRRASDERS